MRTTLLALALVLTAACGSDRKGDRPPPHEDAPSPTPSQGPDPVVLRVARTGGTVRAYVYPRLDSAVWRSSTPAPAIGRVLAFDEESGSLALVDAKGQPTRVDLRSGSVTTASKARLASLASADGYAIYGVSGGAVTRLTPSAAPWPYKPPAPAREVLPQPDGSVIVVGERGGATAVWHLRPPESKVLDSAVLGRTGRAVRTQIGDRVYFTTDSGLVALRGRDLQRVAPVRLDRPVRALAPTPSGDRLYVATDSSAELTVINRYTDKVEKRIALPAPVADLRMDPLGRRLLVRSARGDSVWVVALGTDRVIGAVRSAWLPDLPFVAPDGTVALAQGPDVVFADGETLAAGRRVAGGAKDFWHVLLWNGFRPRAAGLDQPVTFGSEQPDSALGRSDSLDSAFAGGAIGGADSGTAPRAPDSGAPRADSAAAPR
ncbi:MAG: YncE family protein, partial [Gemmatimonadaceae bacterium]